MKIKGYEVNFDDQLCLIFCQFKKHIFQRGKKKKKPSDFYLGKYKKNNKTSILVMKKTEDMKGLGFFLRGISF